MPWHHAGAAGKERQEGQEKEEVMPAYSLWMAGHGATIQGEKTTAK
jgi:hypothetical protein